MKYSRYLVCTVLISLPIFVACGSSDSEDNQGTCSLTGAAVCEIGKVCEAVKDAEPHCFAPLIVAGSVTNAFNGEAVPSAHIVARDVNGVAVSAVSVTDDKGNYSLKVPVERN